MDQRANSFSQDSLQDALIEARNAIEVFAVVKSYGDRFSASTAATALHRVARHVSVSQKPHLVTQLPQFAALMGIIDKHYGDLKHRDVGHIFWSLGKLDWLDDNVMSKLANKWCKKVHSSFCIKDITDVLWACGRLAWFHHDLLEALLDAAVHRVPEFTEQQISNVSWALARLDCFDRPLMEKMSARTIKRIKKFRPQELTTIAWSYATLRHDDPTLMSAIAGSVRGKLNEVTPQDRCNLLWALATLGHMHRPLMVALSTVVFLRARQLSPMEIANMLWATAMLNFEDRVLMSALADVTKMKADEFLDPYWAQLYQVHLVFPTFNLEPELLHKSRAIWINDTKQFTRSSKTQTEVAETLASMGIGCVANHITEDEEFCIDVAIPDQNIAIDVNSPQHFTSNTARPLAHTRCRQRLLEARGWRVLSVPCFVWDAMDKQEQQNYLLALLQPAGSDGPVSLVDSKGSSDESCFSSQMRLSTKQLTRPLSSRASGDSW